MYLDVSGLAGQLAVLAERYRNARPFPHIVFDDFLPQPVAEEMLAAFPGLGDIQWYETDSDAEKKLSTKFGEDNIPPAIRQVIYEMNGSSFITFLEELTGIDGLIPDPHLRGGGLHNLKRGGKLGVHADFNWYKKLRVDRRINLLLYLNRDWQPQWHGQLQLWDEAMTRCEVSLEPRFNRCVIFNTTSTSFHGVPDALECPPDVSRKSVALYYYTSGRPEEEKQPAHGTWFKRRPGVDEPESRFQERNWHQAGRAVAEKLSPPILLDALRYIKRRAQRQR